MYASSSIGSFVTISRCSGAISFISSTASLREFTIIIAPLFSIEALAISSLGKLF